jgi:acyl carrier protein
VIQRAIVLSVFVMSLIGCGSNEAASASRGATPASAAVASSTNDGAVPPVLRSTIADTLKIDESRVMPTAAFAKDLGADELSMVELVMAYERVFKVDIRDPDADQFKTVQNVIDFLRKRNVLR